MKTIFFSILTLLFTFSVFSQSDSQNGDWKSRYVFKQNTSEAAYMIRYGDIDNLGYGWEDGFNPFSGKVSGSHAYPMEKNDSTEIDGFDLVMLGTSYRNNENSRDGYSGALDYLLNTFGKSTFDFKIPLKGLDTSKIKTVTLQMFVDDFQPKEFGSKFEFYINNKRALFVEKTLNSLAQSGPVGKLITLTVTKDFINEFKKDTVVFKFDDNTTGLGDGYAVDFFKILVNPTLIKTGDIKGFLFSADGSPLAKVKLSCGGVSVTSNANGEFILKGIPAGLALITVTTSDKNEKDFTVDVEAGVENQAELRLEQN